MYYIMTTLSILMGKRVTHGIVQASGKREMRNDPHEQVQ
jgi:hypothetical protein